MFICASFPCVNGARVSLAAATPDRVRNRVNLSSSDIADSIVAQFIEDACAEVMLETGLTIDYSNCTQAEASCITDLAALYCLAYLTGGSASGLNFSVGDLHVDVLNEGPPLTILQARLKRMIEKLTTPYLGRA